MAAQHTPHFTPEQYLEMERSAEYKSEYYHGEIFAMAGASYAHVLLVANLSGEMWLALRGRPCRVVTNDLGTMTSIPDPISSPSPANRNSRTTGRTPCSTPSSSLKCSQNPRNHTIED